MIFWGWKKISMEVVLDMLFPSHANMGLLKRKFAKTWDLCQLKMCNITLKNALLGSKSLVRVDYSGICPRKLNTLVKTKLVFYKN